MKFMDMNDDSIITLRDIKREYETFREEDPFNHADTFKSELLNIIMATINGRNDLEIIGATPKEVERMIYRLRN